MPPEGAKPCQWLGSLRGHLFYLAVVRSYSSSRHASLPNMRTHGRLRENAVIPIMARYAALTWVRRDRQQVADPESDARSECQTFAPRLQADCLLHHRSANAQTGGT